MTFLYPSISIVSLPLFPHNNVSFKDSSLELSQVILKESGEGEGDHYKKIMLYLYDFETNTVSNQHFLPRITSTLGV